MKNTKTLAIFNKYDPCGVKPATPGLEDEYVRVSTQFDKDAAKLGKDMAFQNAMHYLFGPLTISHIFPAYNAMLKELKYAV